MDGAATELRNAAEQPRRKEWPWGGGFNKSQDF